MKNKICRCETFTDLEIQKLITNSEFYEKSEGTAEPWTYK